MSEIDDTKALYRTVLRPEWEALAVFLLSERERCITALINADTQQKSDRLRGRISELDILIRLPDQARQFRKENS
jgi:hypothetical protein